MRSATLLLYLFCTIPVVSAQEPENGGSPAFKCTVLYPETAEYPEVTVASDTVKFRLFYVDDECSGFTYRYMQKENLLLLQRTTTSPDSCSTDSQLLYGVEGYIADLPKGKYLFELHTGTTENNLTSIFRDAVTVK